MSQKQFRTYWFAGAATVAVIVAVVAALLLAIIATAQSILANAQQALAVAHEIVRNTLSIWDLEQTNKVTDQLKGGAQAIEQHATQVADALAGPPSTQ
jgi:hypothetical protein